MSNVTFTDIIQSFTGGTTPMDVQGSNPTAPNTKGGNVLLTGGTGTGTGDGGDIIITAGTDGGTGTQGTITFSALDSTTPLPLNETGNTDLDGTFTATSIVGALNELKFSSTISNFTDLLDTPANYTGQANTLVTVNAGETGLVFNSLQSGINNNITVTVPSTLDLGVANLAQLNTRLVSGGNILVQSGTFTLTSTLSIPDNCVIDGSGNEQTIFTRSGNLAMFNLGNNVTIKNCKFDGNNFQGIVLNLDGSVDCTIENCTFIDCLVNSVIIVQNGSNGLNIVGCRFSGTTGNCITVSGTVSSELIVSDCHISNTSVVNCIDLISIDGCTITGNTFKSSVGSSLKGNNIIFCSNVIQNSLGNSIDSSGNNNSIINNIINNGTGVGILINGTGDVNISNNTVIDTSTGIRIIGTGNYIISGNTISDNNIFGLSVSNSSSNITVTGNSIKNNLNNGIFSAGSGTISGNTIENNGNGALYNIQIDDDSGNIIIENNRIIDTSFSTPSLNINIGTGNNNTVCVRSNMTTSINNSSGALNPYDDNVVCNTGTYTLGDLVLASAGHKIFFNAASAGVTINPNSVQGFTNIVLSALNENATFEWTGYAWKLISKSSTITATGVIPHYIGTGSSQSIGAGNTIIRFSDVISSSNIIENASGFEIYQTGFYQVSASFSTDTGTGGPTNMIAYINYSGDSFERSEYRLSHNATSSNIPVILSSTIKVDAPNIINIIARQSNALGQIANFKSVSIVWIAPI